MRSEFDDAGRGNGKRWSKPISSPLSIIFVLVMQSQLLILIAFQSVLDHTPLMMLVVSACHAHVLQMKYLQHCMVQVYAYKVDSIVEVWTCKIQEIEVILL